MRRLIALSPLAFALACSSTSPTPAKNNDAPPPPPPPPTDQVERGAFNKAAPAAFQPFFWIGDENSNGALDPSELAVLHGMSANTRAAYVANGAFTPAFHDAYAVVVKTASAAADADPRRAAVHRELAQGQPTLIQNDFTAATEAERTMVDHVLAAAAIVEDLHGEQIGSAPLKAMLPADHPASHTLFYRNQGPWCVAPQTESLAECNALPETQPKLSGLYPASIQTPGFCDELAKRKNADELLHQFATVQEGENGELKAVPYHEAYAEQMAKVAEHLEAAATALAADPNEESYRTYLQAAAKAFRDGSWTDADEAWSGMNVNNSKWYLRIGPDEVYFEPCSRKAGFHVSFALINQKSLDWQEKLDPVKQEMEKAIAKKAGRPYKERKVSFHLPDFIDIILNAGDARSAHGATIGQSLPNWGPVANEGRGRTVAMTNLYTDTDSRAALTEQAKSLLCPATMEKFVSDPGPQVMGTVLHEAAHNLGPAHEYKVKRKTASQIFGGRMASTLEELKAQTAALWYTDWLVKKGIIDQQTAEHSHVRNVVWAFGHISRGMYNAEKKPKPYSQLAAIQLNYLVEKKAAEWKSDEMAANGQDTGCLELYLDKFPKAVDSMMSTVARIKGKGDKRGAKKLQKKYVDGKKVQDLLSTIRERWLRAPKATFVYEIRR